MKNIPLIINQLFLKNFATLFKDKKESLHQFLFVYLFIFENIVLFAFHANMYSISKVSRKTGKENNGECLEIMINKFIQLLLNSKTFFFFLSFFF